MIKRLMAIMFLSALVCGCEGFVRQSDYDRNMAEMANRLRTERADKVSRMADLENRLSDKNRTLSSLTERYMEMQKEKEELQVWRGGFNLALEAIAKDVAELKLVITKNMDDSKGLPATELLIKVVDLEYRLNELRKKSGEARP